MDDNNQDSNAIAENNKENSEKIIESDMCSTSSSSVSTNNESEKLKINQQVLELIVYCAIHLDIMVDPRKLACQHSFCYDCLVDLVKSSNSNNNNNNIDMLIISSDDQSVHSYNNNNYVYNGYSTNFQKKQYQLICPTCRSKEPSIKHPNDVKNLPRALCEKQLIDVIAKNRKDSQVFIDSTTVCNSLSSSREQINHTISTNNSGNASPIISSLNQRDFHRNIASNNNTNANLCASRNIISSHGSSINEIRSPPSVTMFDTNNSINDITQIESVREYMSTFSDYKMLNPKLTRRICKSLDPRRGSLTNSLLTDQNCASLTFEIFDVDITDHQLVLVNIKSSKFHVYSENNDYRDFLIEVEFETHTYIIEPTYIRVFSKNLYLTGSFMDNNRKPHYTFIHSDLYGNILTQSAIESDQIDKMIGFDVKGYNLTNTGTLMGNEYLYTFICYPNRKCIKIFDEKLIEQSHFYQFEVNNPEYVAYYKQDDQLWVSCPRNQRILIVELKTGAFRQFHTDNINKAIPTNICCTYDDRIIFLDSKSNKFIWIKRIQDYILTQKLNIRHSSLTNYNSYTIQPSISLTASTNFLANTNGSYNNCNSLTAQNKSDINIKLFQTLPMSMLLVGTDDNIILYQPSKYSSRPLKMCLLL